MVSKVTIKSYQFPWETEKMEALKKKTGKDSSKDALTVAVEAYLEG